MDRAFKSGASATPPAAPVSPSIGYPSAGNPGTGAAPTEPGPYFYHMIVEELLAVIVGAGISPNQSSLTQLKSALDVLYGGTSQYMLVRDEKTSGATGGASVVGAQTRTLNTVAVNTISGASLASNQITLPAGTYRVTASAPAANVNNHQAYLYNVTDSAVAMMGTSEQSTAAVATDWVSTSSVVKGRLVLAAPKVFELRHNTGAVYSSGLGVATSTGTEVYSWIEILKES